MILLYQYHHTFIHFTFYVVLFTVTDPCGIDKPRVISDSPFGEITSPNYPGNYPDDADCQWQITVDSGSIIRLTFVEFDVEDG